MINSVWIFRSIYVAASLGIADLLHDRSKGVDELAVLLNLPKLTHT
ncbi:MAG: hypothetical protein F6K22_20115 [Okeania sp. SIO2F4]|nr:hypothetical protein [Okeania sp. SIO2F4]NES04933.1 hypothetical protein [Okeania sp. SIO2F4]